MIDAAFSDSAHREAFSRDGYVRAPLLERGEVEALLDVYRSHPSGMESGFYTTLWSADRSYRRRVHEAVTAILRPHLQRYLDGGRLILTQFAVKQAGQHESNQCPLHQDWSFVDELRHRPISIWCPLVDVTMDHGPLAVVPGSHRILDTPRANFPLTENFQPLSPLFDLFQRKYTRELCLSAGECLFYDGALVHGSRPNHTTEDRVVVVAVVIPKDAQLRHFWRSAADSVEVFNVDEEFFLGDVRVGHRPDGKPAEVWPSALPATPVTEQDYLRAVGAAAIGNGTSSEHDSPPTPSRCQSGRIGDQAMIFHDSALEAEFRRQGYVIVPFLSEDTVAQLLRFFEETRTPAVAGFHGTMYHNDADYRRQIDTGIRPLISSAIAQWMRDYRPCCCNFMVKEAGDVASELPLHQDWSFVREPEEIAVHVWSPLVDVDHENGNLAVVPGSHHLSDPIRAFADDCPFREQFDQIRKTYLVELPMKAGHAVLFDGRLVHSSPPNQSNARRVCVQAITIPATSTLHHCWRVSPTQVEMYQVTDDFFFDYVLHQPPRGGKSLGRIDYAPRQLGGEQIQKLDEYRVATSVPA